MKNKIIALLLVIAILFSFSSSLALAATLSVTKIGALDLGGKNYKQWWYTSTNPTLYGKASPSSEVKINIDGTEGSATSDSSGNWQFYSDKLTNGNHQVTITSGGETVAFALNIGQGMPEGTASAGMKGGNPVPVTGGSNLILYIGLSAVLIISGSLIIARRK